MCHPCCDRRGRLSTASRLASTPLLRDPEPSLRREVVRRDARGWRARLSHRAAAPGGGGREGAAFTEGPAPVEVHVPCGDSGSEVARRRAERAARSAVDALLDPPALVAGVSEPRRMCTVGPSCRRRMRALRDRRIGHSAVFALRAGPPGATAPDRVTPLIDGSARGSQRSQATGRR
jgi:hypothetical protein